MKGIPTFVFIAVEQSLIHQSDYDVFKKKSKTKNA
jgi:hypothetical protein